MSATINTSYRQQTIIKFPGIKRQLKDKLLQLKQQALVVWFLARQPETPLYIKLLAFAVAAYAFSPIDLIPDFIPVLGILDDLIIVPLGVYLVIRLSSDESVQQARLKADEALTRPRSMIAALVIVAIWLILILIVLGLVYSLWPARS